MVNKKEKKNPTEVRKDQMRNDIDMYMQTMGERELHILHKVAQNLHFDMIKGK